MLYRYFCFCFKAECQRFSLSTSRTFRSVHFLHWLICFCCSYSFHAFSLYILLTFQHCHMVIMRLRNVCMMYINGKNNVIWVCEECLAHSLHTVVFIHVIIVCTSTKPSILPESHHVLAFIRITVLIFLKYRKKPTKSNRQRKMVRTHIWIFWFHFCVSNKSNFKIKRHFFKI